MHACGVYLHIFSHTHIYICTVRSSTAAAPAAADDDYDDAAAAAAAAAAAMMMMMMMMMLMMLMMLELVQGCEHVAGTEVWSRCEDDSQIPPFRGWQVPWNGPVQERCLDFGGF